jgi:hypothetical protein
MESPSPDPHRIPPDGCAWLLFFLLISAAFVVGITYSLLNYFFPISIP